MEAGNQFLNYNKQMQVHDDSFGCIDEWTTDSTAIFDCDVSIKSIHEEEFCNIYVSSFINWCNPNWEFILSLVLSLKLDLSWL